MAAPTQHLKPPHVVGVLARVAPQRLEVVALKTGPPGRSPGSATRRLRGPASGFEPTGAGRAGDALDSSLCLPPHRGVQHPAGVPPLVMRPAKPSRNIRATAAVHAAYPARLDHPVRGVQAGPVALPMIVKPTQPERTRRPLTPGQTTRRRLLARPTLRRGVHIRPPLRSPVVELAPQRATGARLAVAPPHGARPHATNPR